MNRGDDFADPLLWNGGEIVQLKTVGRREMDGAVGDLLRAMDALAASRQEFPSAGLKLDTRTEPGRVFSQQAIDRLSSAAESLGVTLTISPFP